MNNKLGKKLKAARIKAQLTQSALAKRLKFSTAYISGVERGIRGVTDETLKRWEKIFCSRDPLIKKPRVEIKLKIPPNSKISVALVRRLVERLPYLTAKEILILEALLCENLGEK